MRTYMAKLNDEWTFINNPSRLAGSGFILVSNKRGELIEMANSKERIEIVRYEQPDDNSPTNLLLEVSSISCKNLGEVNNVLRMAGFTDKDIDKIKGYVIDGEESIEDAKALAEERQ